MSEAGTSRRIRKNKYIEKLIQHLDEYKSILIVQVCILNNWTSSISIISTCNQQTCGINDDVQQLYHSWFIRYLSDSHCAACLSNINLWFIQSFIDQMIHSIVYWLNDSSIQVIRCSNSLHISRSHKCTCEVIRLSFPQSFTSAVYQFTITHPLYLFICHFTCQIHSVISPLSHSIHFSNA